MTGAETVDPRNLLEPQAGTSQTASGAGLSPETAVARFLDGFSTPLRLLVAVSGGSDSIGLLHLLALDVAARRKDAAARPGVSLCAATVDHGLRPEATDEARAVARLCGRLGIPHRIMTWTGPHPRTGLMEAARVARYRLLREAAQDMAADAIVIAHTSDDQAETRSMRAGRNGGPLSLGMSGIPAASLIEGRIWVLRPLLRSRRDDIRRFLVSIGVPWQEDPSNGDPRFERVRVRRQLASAPAAPTQPGTDAPQRAALSSAGAALITTHCALLHRVMLRLSPDALLAERSVLRHVVATLLAIAGGRAHRPGAETLDRIMAALAGGKALRLSAARALIERRRDGLYICRDTRLLPQPGTEAPWDGRFYLLPARLEPSSGEADAAAITGAELPPRLAALAARVAPPAGYHASPAFPLFDHFLPLDDLPLADAVARLYGRAPFPRPPGTAC